MILILERRLALVVLLNSNSRFDSFLGDMRLPMIPVGVVELLLGQSPTVVPAGRTPTLLFGTLLLAVAVQVAGMARTAILLRRWSCRPEQRPQSRVVVAVRVGLPLLANMAWACLPW